jgi:hypothetical protein
VAAVLTLNAATGLVEAVAFAHLGGVFAAFPGALLIGSGLVAAAAVTVAAGSQPTAAQTFPARLFPFRAAD